MRKKWPASSRGSEPMYLLAHEGSQSEGRADMLALAEGNDGGDLGSSWQHQLLLELANLGLPHHGIHVQHMS